MKDYLGFENARNKQHAALYERLLRLALKDEKSVSVLIGHHVCFEIAGDLNTENEIPSADCLMFDHELMTRVFGTHAKMVMTLLALTPVEERDEELEELLNRYALGGTYPFTVLAPNTSGVIMHTHFKYLLASLLSGAFYLALIVYTMQVFIPTIEEACAKSTDSADAVFLLTRGGGHGKSGGGHKGGKKS